MDNARCVLSIKHLMITIKDRTLSPLSHRQTYYRGLSMCLVVFGEK